MGTILGRQFCFVVELLFLFILVVDDSVVIATTEYCSCLYSMDSFVEDFASVFLENNQHPQLR